MVQQIGQFATETSKHLDDLFLSVGVSDPFQPVTFERLTQYRNPGFQHAAIRLPTANPERLNTVLDELEEKQVLPAQAS